MSEKQDFNLAGVCPSPSFRKEGPPRLIGCEGMAPQNDTTAGSYYFEFTSDGFDELLSAALAVPPQDPIWYPTMAEARLLTESWADNYAFILWLAEKERNDGGLSAEAIEEREAVWRFLQSAIDDHTSIFCD